MKTICFYNHKGGVGKTTLTYSIAGELVSKKKKVLLLDADSQANLSSLFCQNPQYELSDYLFNNKSIDLLKKVILETKYEHLYIIPNKKLSEDGRLDLWTQGFAGQEENRNVIKTLIKLVETFGFDYTLIDMPPSYSPLDKKFLLSSDEVIPILKIDTFSIDGIKDFYLLLNKLKDGDEKPFFRRYIFNSKDLRTNMQKQLLGQIEKIEFKKYIVPVDTIFEKSKATKKLPQAMDGMKKETRETLEKIANDILEES